MKGEEEVPDRREATPDDASLEPAPADVEPGLQIEALLAERDPLLLLPRLIEDDPLELQARARRRLRTRAVFVCRRRSFSTPPDGSRSPRRRGRRRSI